MRFLVLVLVPLLLWLPLSAEYRIVFLGDSITEGFGVAEEQSFPSLVAAKFREDGIEDVEIINSGFSGSTSASAPNRMKWLIKSKPDLVFLALGGNDGLRGISVESIGANLRKAIDLAKSQNVAVIMTGMQMPPNYGKQYTEAFAKVFFRVARETSTPIVPFLLEGVAADPELNLPDGIHPNPKGQRVIADMVYPYVKKAYDSASK